MLRSGRWGEAVRLELLEHLMEFQLLLLDMGGNNEIVMFCIRGLRL